MRAFLRRWLGIVDVVNDVEIKRELDDLRDDIEHLGRRFTKLQGQVTRAWREEVRYEDDDVPDDSDDEFADLLARRRSERA